ncbi:MAG: hypothetical protein JO354_12605 [Verrucomicrobia bacterium]|nr:hypothetical protein [Verrucomicrobiota bacterium]
MDRKHLLAAAIITAFAVALFAAASDIEIHVTPKKLDATQPQNEANGTRTVSSERWNYEVTLENKSFRPLSGLEARYIIFYKTEQLGSKEPAEQQRQSGTFSLDAMQAHEKKTFTSNAVELKHSHLTGHWFFPAGERIKADDTLVGIWVRVYQGDQLLGEYANPSTLAREQWQ